MRQRAFGLSQRHDLGADRTGPDGGSYRRAFFLEFDFSHQFARRTAIRWLPRHIDDGEVHRFPDAFFLVNRDVPVFLIVDGHPVHRSKAVKRFVSSTQGQLRMFPLPPYRPDLNPDEWVWNHLKRHKLGRVALTGPDHLKRRALGFLRSLQRQPAVVRAFFQQPSGRYAA